MSSRPVFHAALPDPLPSSGSTIRLDGPEGRHASVVRRIRVGEPVLLSDGVGRGVAGSVVHADKTGLSVEVSERVVEQPP
ncbi:MAG: 16S rRNA (uracil(1498)-N(3))-methyltransferase, partial [Microlunatus sp.]|nr:16S rRNA (uracil(1498)-N(3))-methyltransferase [Microlunatus sp.]